MKQMIKHTSNYSIRGFGLKAPVTAIAVLLLNILLIQKSMAQSPDAAAKLLQTKAIADSMTRLNPAEKIYLQLDKNTYTPGDTLWFKAYLFNAPTLNLSAKSGIMYVSILTDSSVVIKKQRLPVENGLSWGNISLKELPAGNYTLVAYTQWLQNFGNDCFIYKHFTIADDATSNWLANYTSSSAVVGGKEQADVKLLLSDLEKTPVAGKLVQLAVMKGRRRLYKQAIQTDDKGLIDINFNLPDKPGDIRIIANDAGGNRVNIPLNFNRVQDADVQFMPEGGDLIASLPAHIGFKAIGLDGKGIDVTGVVLDREKQPVGSFTSQHLGMGCLDLAVKPGEKYTAKATFANGFTKEYPLPDVKNSGIVLKVDDEPGKDSVKVLLSATDDITNTPGNAYFLIGKAREIICYGGIVNFKSGASISRKISKKLFPSGITHFILLDVKNQSLNERLIFINHHDNLRINVSADKTVYAPHDSVAVHINVADALGNPLRGKFSIAVTDDAQVHPDSLNSENIVTRMLLTSELKGYVEQPDYYFNAVNNQSRLALDNLLLTQGWVNYDWPDEKKRTVYNAETGFAVKGHVLNVFSKPVQKTKIQLFSKRPVVVADTITGKDGAFTFRNLPLADTPVYFIKTAKNFNVTITIDDAQPPALWASAGQTVMPWYVSNDTTLLNSVKNNRARQNLANDLPVGTRTLKEVKVIAKKIVKGSQNLNGPGNADLAFDEADLENAGKQTWLQFLEQKVPGFHVGSVHRPIGPFVDPLELARYESKKYALKDKHPMDLAAAPSISTGETYNFLWYFIEDRPIKLIIDGMSFSEVLKSPNLDDPDYITVKNYLERYNAEDIKGVEVNISNKYSSEYFGRYIYSEWRHNLTPSDFAFVEITTRSGKGPAIQNTPGAYLYKPLALSIPAHFYSPRYLVNDKSKHVADLRSTIHWEPNLSTGADGKATVSFYTADKPSTYTYIIEGTNMDGSLGYVAGKIKVSSNTSP